MNYRNLTIEEKLNESRDYQEQLEWIKALNSTDLSNVRAENAGRAHSVKILESFQPKSIGRTWASFWRD
jgi:hypothetical protein